MLPSTVFVFILILYSMASIVISRRNNDISNLWISFGMFLYTIGCFYVVINSTAKYNCVHILNVLAFLINFGISVSTCGILFGGWYFHMVFSFQLILFSLWVMVYRFHLDKSPVDIVFVESNRKRVTFLEIE